MLPKAHRIAASDMKAVLQKGKRFSFSWFHLVVGFNSLSTSRFAVVVATRVDKRATARNRVKRLVRESLRHLLPKVVTGKDVLVQVRTKPPKDSQANVEVSLQQALTRANLL